MTIDEFKLSLSDPYPPKSLSQYLVALWHDGNGDWDSSHDIAQDIEDSDGSWIHAYLHRKEGDEWNAGYWYRRAGKPFFNGSLEEEWTELAMEFLKK